MIAPSREELSGPLEAARRFAALSGPFRPLDALSPEILAKPVDAAMVASLLASACDTEPPGEDDRWLMRVAERHDVLGSLAQGDGVSEAATERWANKPDAETRDLLAVLLDREPLSRAQIEVVIAEAKLRQDLERVVLALDRAGEAAPARDLLVPARNAVAAWDARERRRRMRERPFCGRETEKTRLADWMKRDDPAPPVRCLFVTGAPGIGKSSLLSETVLHAFDSRCPLLLRLDFDKAGLDVRDRVGLTMEAARQIGEQLGKDGVALLETRLDAAAYLIPGNPDTISLSEAAPTTGFTPRDLAEKIGEATTASGKSILIVLDTLEVLRGRGDSHPPALFEWLDDLARAGLKPQHVLAAGRGDALDSCKDRYGDDRIDLPALSADEAKQLLERLGAPAATWEDLTAIAEGNPLKLRLGAEIVRRFGGEKLPRRKRGAQVDAAFLYRFLLSRIDDPLLKKLAHPGLIVRRISADVIRDVLAPKLGLGNLTGARAAQLLDELAAHHWLVEPETDPQAAGFLKHRADMRALLLPLLYRSAPRQSARIDEAAMQWFLKRPERWCEVEAAYHRLQLMRTRDDPPGLATSLLAQIDDEMCLELPRPARDLVLAAQGRRTESGRAAAVAGVVDEAAVTNDLLGILQRQDWAEGQYFVNDIITAGGVDARSQAADAIRAFLWRSGRWAVARGWLRERDRLVAGDQDLGSLPLILALPRLEMRAEFAPRALSPALSHATDVKALAEAAVAASDNLARNGAMAMILAGQPGAWPHVRASSRDSDLAAAARAVWGTGDAAHDAEAAFELGRERIRQRLQRLPASGGVAQERLLNTLTPYAAVAAALVQMSDRHWLADDARLVGDHLQEVGGLLGGLGAGAPIKPAANPVSGIAELGLFAEWATASAFLRRDRDLALIGRAAERWRRTMAGSWAYGRAPAGWVRRGPLDACMAERLEGLRAGPDPTGAALRQLALWDGGGRPPTDPNENGERIAGILRKRFGRVVAAARAGDASPEDILAVFLRSYVPSGLAPPFAILVHNGRF